MMDSKAALEAALKELMNQHPIDKITVEQIALQAQLSKQTFYRHFKDKYALLEYSFEKLLSPFAQILEGRPRLRF